MDNMQKPVNGGNYDICTGDAMIARIVSKYINAVWIRLVFY